MLIFFRAHWFRTSSSPSLPAITRKTRKGFAALALAAAVALPQTGFTQSALTLAEAQRIAVERSRQLAAQDASITAAREMAVAAGQLPDPVLRLGIDNLPIDGADRFSVGRDFMTMRRIGVMQEFTRDDKRRLRTARGERDADRALTPKRPSRLPTFSATRRWPGSSASISNACAPWSPRKPRKRALRSKRPKVLTAPVAAARPIFIPRALHALRSRIGCPNWIAAFVTPVSCSRAGWVTLQMPRSRVSPQLRPSCSRAHTLDQALERHPEIALLGRQVAVAESEVQLARANKRSDWSVELAYQERGPAFSNMISVGVSIPLQWDQKNRQDRELGAKLALAERAKALREDMLRAHTAEVRTMLNEWENGHERLARYERELIPLAKDRTQAALAAYRGGKADLNAVLAARRNEIEVRTQTVQLEMETARLWAQLNFLVPDGAHESHSGAAAAAREEK